MSRRASLWQGMRVTCDAGRLRQLCEPGSSFAGAARFRRLAGLSDQGEKPRVLAPVVEHRRILEPCGRVATRDRASEPGERTIPVLKLPVGERGVVLYLRIRAVGAQRTR